MSTQEPSPLPPFVEVQIRDFASFDDAADWALRYLNIQLEVNLAYLRANVRNRALVAYNQRVLDAINVGLQRVIKEFGMNAKRIQELEKFMNRMRQEVLHPLEAIPLTD